MLPTPVHHHFPLLLCKAAAAGCARASQPACTCVACPCASFWTLGHPPPPPPDPALPPPAAGQGRQHAHVPPGSKLLWWPGHRGGAGEGRGCVGGWVQLGVEEAVVVGLVLDEGRKCRECRGRAGTGAGAPTMSSGSGRARRHQQVPPAPWALPCPLTSPVSPFDFPSVCEHRCPWVPAWPWPTSTRGMAAWRSLCMGTEQPTRWGGGGAHAHSLLSHW